MKVIKTFERSGTTVVEYEAEPGKRVWDFTVAGGTFRMTGGEGSEHLSDLAIYLLGQAYLSGLNDRTERKMAEEAQEWTPTPLTSIPTSWEPALTAMVFSGAVGGLWAMGGVVQVAAAVGVGAVVALAVGGFKAWRAG